MAASRAPMCLALLLVLGVATSARVRGNRRRGRRLRVSSACARGGANGVYLACERGAPRRQQAASQALRARRRPRRPRRRCSDAACCSPTPTRTPPSVSASRDARQSTMQATQGGAHKQHACTRTHADTINCTSDVTIPRKPFGFDGALSEERSSVHPCAAAQLWPTRGHSQSSPRTHLSRATHGLISAVISALAPVLSEPALAIDKLNAEYNVPVDCAELTGFNTPLFSCLDDLSLEEGCCDYACYDAVSRTMADPKVSTSQQGVSGPPLRREVLTHTAPCNCCPAPSRSWAHALATSPPRCASSAPRTRASTPHCCPCSRLCEWPRRQSFRVPPEPPGGTAANAEPHAHPCMHAAQGERHPPLRHGCADRLRRE